MMMNIRYSYIKYMVNKIFIDQKINSYPIDITKVALHTSNCRIIPYSVHMKKHNLSIVEVFLYFGSDEGCTFYSKSKNRYLIFYNDLNLNYKTPERRRWTIAHELGHVILDHLIMTDKVKLFRNKLTDEEYECLEVEANRFASILLANPIILHELNIKDNTDIMKICKLSEEASVNRFSDYIKWCKKKYLNKYDSIILKQFYRFIYLKQCTKCNYTFISKLSNYCPICGNNKFVRSDVNVAHYDSYDLDRNGHAKICPTCGNEEIYFDSVFCQICGTYLINECACTYVITETNFRTFKESCGKPANGNARYCRFCGNQTTFFQKGLLIPWNNHYIDEVSSSIESINENSLPF